MSLENATKTYKFSMGGVNFDDYSQIRMLTLDTEAKQGTPITLHYPDSSTDYQVPPGKVFIAFLCSICVTDATTIVRFGMSGSANDTVDGQEVIKVSTGLTNIPSMEYVIGFFTANKYVTAETNSSTKKLKVDSVLYGIEVDA